MSMIKTEKDGRSIHFDGVLRLRPYRANSAPPSLWLEGLDEDGRGGSVSAAGVLSGPGGRLVGRRVRVTITLLDEPRDGPDDAEPLLSRMYFLGRRVELPDGTRWIVDGARADGSLSVGSEEEDYRDRKQKWIAPGDLPTLRVIE